MTPQALAAAIAKELRANPKAWTQGSFARDVHGNHTGVHSPDAVCWCLMGHAERRTGSSLGATTRFYDAVRAANGSKSDTAAWNDAPRRTVEEVIEVLDKVAAS